jgi:hypothetical protein
MAAGGQAPYVEPWDLEKNGTPQNKLIRDMYISSRGRLLALARRSATIQMFFATSAAPEGTPPSVQEVHTAVWKDACKYVLSADGKKALEGPALEEALGKFKQQRNPSPPVSPHKYGNFE